MPNRPGNDDRITAGGMGSSNSQTNISSAGANQNGSQSGGSRSRSNRGFASMDREKQREIASKGGRAAHAKGTAHEFDSGEAREAGRKGGMAVSRNREHMAAIGRRGGEARGQARNRSTAQVNSGGAGSTAEGSFQNSRNGASASSADRQVAINTNSDGVTSNSQGVRGGNASLGGERRTNVGGSDASTSNETFGNH